MILGTASDGEYRTEIAAEAPKNREPTSGGLQNARMLADRIRQMCEADLECRRLAPAWKLVTIVLNNALPYLLTVALSRLKPWLHYAQELDEVVEALFPLFVGQDRLEPLTVKRMRLPRNAGGFDATPVLLRSPTAFLAQYLAIAPSVAKAAGVRATETLGIVDAARDAQRRLRLMGSDERGMPREGDSPNRERWTFARVGNQALRKRQASWKQPLAEAATKTGPLADSAARLHRLGRRERTVAHDE